MSNIKRDPRTDKKRGQNRRGRYSNIFSEKLCDDLVEYMKTAPIEVMDVENQCMEKEITTRTYRYWKKNYEMFKEATEMADTIRAARNREDVAKISKETGKISKQDTIRLRNCKYKGVDPVTESLNDNKDAIIDLLNGIGQVLPI